MAEKVEKLDKHNVKNLESCKNNNLTSICSSLRSYKLLLFPKIRRGCEVKLKSAFTLGEVLITLAIIGIIAAVTLPILNKKIQHKILEVKFKKSVTLLNQIILQAKYDLQVENLYNYCYYYYTQNNKTVLPNSQACYKSIAAQNLFPKPKYENKYSISRSFDDIYTFNGNVISSLSNNESAIRLVNILRDGSYLGYTIGGGRVSFGVDLNGNQGPNRLGHDIFLFAISNDTKNSLISYSTPNNNLTDEQAQAKWENSTSASKNYFASIEGGPCNLTSQRKGNGVGCAYYALRNKCPWDNKKTYWECLP